MKPSAILTVTSTIILMRLPTNHIALPITLYPYT